MEGSITTYLLTQGVLGLAVLVLGLVVVKLYNKTERLEKEKSDLMEARRLDYKETLSEVSDILQSNSQSNLILAEKIESAKNNQRNQP